MLIGGALTIHVLIDLEEDPPLMEHEIPQRGQDAPSDDPNKGVESLDTRNSKVQNPNTDLWKGCISSDG
jgi:hypothetical protein